jgi:hypothetical protein
VEALISRGTIDGGRSLEMSKKLQASITCPSCKKQTAYSLFRSLWIEYKENRELVFSDRVNYFICPKCGYEKRLEFPFMCTNAKKRFAVWYEPYHDEQIDIDAEAYRKQMGIDSYLAQAPRIKEWDEFKDTILALENVNANSRHVNPELSVKSSLELKKTAPVKKRLLDFIFSKVIKRENIDKPFFKNKSNADRKDWFLRTRPWHKVDPKVIDVLIEKFGEDPMFEVFVFTATELGLIDRFEKLAESNDDAEMICSQIAAMFCCSGNEKCRILLSRSADCENGEDIESIKHLHCLVVDAYEIANILDKKQVGGFLGLATIYASLNDTQKSLNYALEGLNRLNQLKIGGHDVVLKEKRPDMWRTLVEADIKLKALISMLSKSAGL